MHQHSHAHGPEPERATSAAAPSVTPTPDAQDLLGNATLNEELVAAPPQPQAATSVLAAAESTVGASSDPGSNPLGRRSSPAPRQEGEQRVVTDGIAIVGRNVSPTAIAAAEGIVQALVGNRPDVQERMRETRATVVIIPRDQRQTDVPEFAHLAGKTTFDGRQWNDVRGSGGSLVPSGEFVIAVPEENLVQIAGVEDRYGAGYSVALHEIAHAVHLKGMRNSERERLTELYSQQRGDARGFTDAYGSSNVQEYFAQSTNAYFGMNSIGGNGAAWLEANDPDMHAFLQTVYGDPQRSADGAASATPASAASPAAPAAAPAAGAGRPGGPRARRRRE